MLGTLNYMHDNTLFLIDNAIRLYFDLPFGIFFIVTFFMLFIGIPMVTFMYFVYILELFIRMDDPKYCFADQSYSHQIIATISTISALIGFYIMIYSVIYRFTSAEFFQSNNENLQQQQQEQQQEQDDDHNLDIFNEHESMHNQEQTNNPPRSRRSSETYRERRDRRPPRFRTTRVIFQGIEKHSKDTQRYIAELYYKYLLHYNDAKMSTKNGINKFKREILYRYGRDQYDPKLITTFKRYRNSVLEQDYTQYMLVKNRYHLSDDKQRIPKLQEIIRSKIRVYGTPEMQADLSLIDDHLKYNNKTIEVKVDTTRNDYNLRKRIDKKLSR